MINFNILQNYNNFLVQKLNFIYTKEPINLQNIKLIIIMYAQ